MATPMELIVGLGNPGKEYENTRHNAGVWWIDYLLEKYNLSIKIEPKFFGKVATLKLDNYSLKIFVPTTFMNESGRAVAAIAKFYKIPSGKILIAHDDLDLAPGAIKLKLGGGHGGHNGLRDITSALGSKNFARFKIGIGHPGDKHKVANFVLKSPNKLDSENIHHSLNVSLDFFPEIIFEKWDKVMNALHTLPIK